MKPKIFTIWLFAENVSSPFPNLPYPTASWKCTDSSLIYPSITQYLLSTYCISGTILSDEGIVVKKKKENRGKKVKSCCSDGTYILMARNHKKKLLKYIAGEKVIDKCYGKNNEASKSNNINISLLCTGHCFKCFSYINSMNPYNNPNDTILIPTLLVIKLRHQVT